MPLAQNVGCSTCPSATLTMSMPPRFDFIYMDTLESVAYNLYLLLTPVTRLVKARYSKLGFE